MISRLRETWRLDRAGKVVQDSVHEALKLLRQQKKATRTGTTWNLPNREVTVARTPAGVFNRKKVSQVPALERRIALCGLLSESPGMSRDDLAKETARFFGWLRLGSDIKAAFTSDIDALITAGSIEEKPSGLVLAEDRHPVM